MSNLVIRLRAITESNSDMVEEELQTVRLAAEEIERLRTDNHKLRSLLETAVDAFESGTYITQELVTGTYWHARKGIVSVDWVKAAKKAMGGVG